MSNAHQISLARVVASYLLRGLWRRVDWSSIQKERQLDINEELANSLVPLAVSERSVLGWCRALCTRFEINPTGGGYESGGQKRRSGPAYALIPRHFLPAGTTEMDRDTGDDNIPAIRWDIACTLIDFHALRIVLHENPAFFATFATAAPAEGEEALFDFVEDSPTAKPWLPVRPKRTISPRVFRTVWELQSPFYHGADEKTGNVSLLRRERAVSPLTGEQYLRPFLSGNAWRGGVVRDRIFGLLLRRVGLRFEELPPARAHALLAGGSIEAGADTGKVDVAARRRARAIPPWDLIAGCIDSQIMDGCLKAHDAHLLCRENAWFLYEILNPTHDDGSTMTIEEFAASLKPADDLTQLRLGTRHAHRDLEGSKGSQMFWNVEGILAGASIVHSFQLASLNGVSELTKSCLADLLEDFRDDAMVGAQTSRGYGRISFNPYTCGEGVEGLPSPTIYREWVEENRDMIREWLLACAPVDDAEKPAKGKAKPKGKTVKIEMSANGEPETMDAETGEMVPLETALKAQAELF